MLQKRLWSADNSGQVLNLCALQYAGYNLILSGCLLHKESDGRIIKKI